MNKRLEQALAELVRLPDNEQESIAALILEEIAAERAWDERFAKSESKLAELGRRAREQHRRGETSALEFPSKE
jgi:hypothetical protein